MPQLNENLTQPAIRIGLPQMLKEPGERRDFLPPFVAWLQKSSAQVYLEHGYGGEMGFSERDYLEAAPGVEFVPHKEAFRQDYVLVLRCPLADEIRLMHPGACLISMLHYPTRPERVAFLRSLQLEAISMDSLKDDSGRRLVEYLKAVAWNGVEAAFQTLVKTYPPPGFASPDRPPVRVTLLGAGAVGVHVVQAAIHYGNTALREKMVENNIPGVQVTTIDYDLTNLKDHMLELLSKTDILVDATQRADPTKPVIPNDWIGAMPAHAILLDLSVDPYNCNEEPYYVKGIEGIPQGNLDQYVFTPNDPAYKLIPDCIDTTHRRYSVSCYSWPGIHPKQCMEVYGRQLRPILHVLMEKGGIQNIAPNGRFFERAIARAQLSRWLLTNGRYTQEDLHRSGY